MNAARALLSVTVRQARPVASRQCQQFRLLSAVAPTGGKETKSMTVETSAATESELEHERGLQGTITVQGPADISLVSVRITNNQAFFLDVSKKTRAQKNSKLKENPEKTQAKFPKKPSKIGNSS